MKFNELKKKGLSLNSIFFLITLIAILMAYVPKSMAVNIHVPDDHSTIQAAIEAANSGDVIIIEPGIYMENIDFLGKAIIVKSTDPNEHVIVATTVIRGNADKRVVTFENEEGADSILMGLTILNGKGGISCSSASPTIINCVIKGNYTGVGGGIYCKESSPIITKCIIEQNSVTGSYGYSGEGGGIYCSQSSPIITECIIRQNYAKYRGGGIFCEDSSPTLLQCTISHNDEQGLYCSSSSSPTITNCIINGNVDGGIYCSSSNLTIMNCTISENNEFGIFLPSASDPSFCSLVITNSILWNNPPQEINGPDECITVTYSNIQQETDIYPGTGNINIDPLFIKTEQIDLYLSPNSPCIDIGTSTNAPSEDRYGFTRPQGGGIDMGAYEHVNPSSSIPRALFTVDKTSGEDTLTVTFDASASGASQYTGALFSWDFGDGSTGSGVTISHDYSFGSYDVSLTITTGSGSHTQTLYDLIKVKSTQATKEVGEGYTYTSIQDAIDEAGYGEIILVHEGRYTENIHFNGKAITVRSQNGADTTIIDGNGNGSVVTFNYLEGPDSVLQGFSIQNGSESGIYCSSSPTITNCIIKENTSEAGGGIFCFGSSPIIDNCTIIENSASNGAGIYCSATYHSSSCRPTIINCTIRQNVASSYGGGIYCSADASFNASCRPSIDNCIITQNMASLDGGGIYFKSCCWPTITNCTVNGNSASSKGGGMCFELSQYYGASADITGCTINDNTASGDGGGIYFTSGSNSTISNCAINGNSTSSYGGGVYFYKPPRASVTHCTINENEALNGGGGIFCYSYGSYSSASSFSISNCIINGNSTSQGKGGGIYCDETSPQITDCFICGNSSSDEGAGLLCDESSPTISYCSIMDNSTSTNGGGIFCLESSPRITNCTINKNSAYFDGGGIYCYTREKESNCSPIITNCLINKNSAPYGGAMYCYKYDASSICAPTLTNCTLSDNFALIGGGIYCWSTLSSISFCSPTITNCILWNDSKKEMEGGKKIVTHSNIHLASGVYPGEGNINADPLFLWNKYGNYYLNPNSPCIDTGTSANAPSVDREGITRPQGEGIDMGAYEYVDTNSCIPRASFIADQVEGTDILSVNFDASSSGGSLYDEALFFWDFGDGSTGSGIMPSRTYSNYGLYDVSLTVTTQCGTHQLKLNEVIAIRSSSLLEVGEGYAHNSIQEAINEAFDGDTILVHDGTYTENINFYGKRIKIVSENGADTTIIDGNSIGPVVSFDHIEDHDSVLEGFTLQNGGDSGIYCFRSSPIITNCIITKNNGSNGGGIECYEASPTITHCLISHNSASSTGGGIFCKITHPSYSPDIRYCIFRKNMAVNGGGLYCGESSPTLTSCTFSENSAANVGGGLCILESWHSFLYPTSPVINNCLINNNSAFNEGGGIYCHIYFRPGGYIDSKVIITNCTISNNTAAAGGGFHNGQVIGWGTSPTVSNCIIWNNSPNQIDGKKMQSTYSDIHQGEGVYPGEGNINTDPLFVASEQGNFYLSPNSPCIDAGTFTNAPLEDREGITRPQGEGIDMGAFEYIGPGSSIPRASFKADNTTGENTLTVTFNASSSGGSLYPGALFFWDFGDDSSGTGLTPSHTYEAPGMFHVSLTITIEQVSHTLTSYDFIEIIPYEPNIFVGEGFLYPSIQEAIDAAMDGDKILVHDGVYKEHINFMGKAITVLSKNGAEAAIIDGEGSGCVVTFNHQEDHDTVLKGFTIQNGSDSGIYCINSSPTITDCIIQKNSAESGGGIIIENASPTLFKCIICENSANKDGGGIYCKSSKPDIDTCTITKNSTIRGGGIYCYESSPVFNHTEIIENTASDGGGMYCIGGPYGYIKASPTFNYCTIRDNVASSKGGGIYYFRESLSTINNSEINKNSAKEGGGIFGSSSNSLNIIDCRISENIADNGGGIILYCPATISQCEISENIADNNGGGIYSSSNEQTITNCIFSLNSATQGGGIFCDHSLFEIKGCIFHHNSSSLGGGIYYNDSYPVISNCTISDNKADDGGGIFCSESSPYIVNTILWNNGSDISKGDETSYPKLSFCDIRGGYRGLGNIEAYPHFVDPNNGDYFLEPDSPCVDAGHPRIYDRDHSRSDIGAYGGEGGHGTIPKDITVDRDGNGDYLVIQDAIDYALQGDSITIYPGLYLENLIIVRKNISIISNEGAKSVTISALEPFPVITLVNLGSGSVLNGFTIKNGVASEGGGILCYYSSPIITKCIVKENLADMGGGIYCYSGSPNIKNCIVCNNTATDKGGGFYCSSSTPTIINCTISNNSSSQYGGMYCYSTSAVIKNCIYWNNSPKEISGGNITFSNIEAESGVYSGSGNINTDPLFIEKGPEYYYLNQTSPCIDKGTPSNAPSEDIVGIARPQGERADMGAYEYVDPNSQIPKAFFTPDQTTGTDSLVVTFNALSSGASQYPGADFLWDFGDGSSGTGINPSHIYNNAGSYDVTLTIITDQETHKLTSYDLIKISSSEITKHVGEGYSYTSIQEAIDDAAYGERILVHDGIYKENINFKGKAITVSSVNGAEGTIIDGDGSGIVTTFNNQEGHDSILEGFTLQNGSNGGILCLNSSPTITNCIISQNSSAGDGGGIICVATLPFPSAPSITDCIIRDNSATNNGGGIYSSSSPHTSCTPMIESCILMRNSAAKGGGMYCSTSPPAITNCTITENTASSDGGGVFFHASSFAITGCSIENNWAGQRGGGLYSLESSLNLSNSIIHLNSANHKGGGIYADESTITIAGCEIKGNNAIEGSGGGVFSFNSPLSVIDCSIYQNSACQSGGGIYSQDFITISDCRVEKNFAGEQGAGIYCCPYNELSSTPTISDSIIINNSAGSYGGGISCRYSEITNCILNGNSSDYSGGGVFGYLSLISDCLVKGNIANSGGGGIYTGGSSSSASSTIAFCTITDNSAGSGGGIYSDNSNSASSSLSPSITSCTISGNKGDNGGGIYCQSTYDSPLKITNCVISENKVSSNGGGMYCNSPRAIITNCTFTQNIARQNGGGLFSDEWAYSNLYNCILWNDLPQEIFSIDERVYVYHSNIQGDSLGYYTGRNNIHTDPLFVRPAQGNYYLNPNSPCIDTGASSNAPLDDMVGIARPQGEGIDMGAFEYVDPNSITPRAVFTTDQTSGIDSLEVAFDASSSGGSLYEGTIFSWDFGDGSHESGIKASHTYSKHGTYNVSLTVTTAGESHTVTLYDFIKITSSQATKHVGEGYAYISIQDAINDAEYGERILVHDGLYAENINFYGKVVSVYSENGLAFTIIDGGKNDSVVVFNHLEGQDTSLEGFTIQNGTDSGIRCINSSPNIKNCNIINNSATNGGGISCATTSNYFSCSPIISNCGIRKNAASNGGGIYCFAFSNHAYGEFIYSTCSPILNNCTISENMAEEDGGGLFCFNSSLTITDCRISNNRANKNGGGIHSSRSHPTCPHSPVIDNCEIMINLASNGGGIYTSAPLSITNCIIHENVAEKDGGGFYNITASPNITNCIIRKNSASNGSGIFTSHGSSQITKCTISENFAYINGAGICCDAYSSPNIVNCLINKNVANYDGGGVCFLCGYSTSSLATITNCTIAENIAYDNDGGISCCSLSPTITNSILWDNLPQEISENCSNDVTFSNIYQESGVYSGTGNINENPLFVKTEQGNFYLMHNSPCIDKGTSTDAPIEDREGMPRPQGAGVDMGAYEFVGYNSCTPRASFTANRMGGTGSTNITFDASSSGASQYNGAIFSWDFGDGSTGQGKTVSHTYTTFGPRHVNLTLSTQCGVHTLTLYDLICIGSVDPTKHVGEGYPYTSIQDAIDEAVSGESILVHDGLYKENINFKGKAINIRSENGTSFTIIKGSESGNVVTFDRLEGQGSILDGFTIQDGSENGIFCLNSSPIIKNCIVINNKKSGIYCKSNSLASLCSPTITDSTIEGNPYSGIICDTSSPTITNCLITNNSSTDGGGIHCTSSLPTINNSIITGNEASESGGGIYCHESSPTITNCLIENNSSQESGGGVFFSASYTSSCWLVITDCTIKRNSSIQGNGGGVNCDNAYPASINNCIISKNSALGTYGKGAGLYFYSSSTFISDSLISENLASNKGGGIYKDNSPSKITNCIFSKNSTSGSTGGAIYLNRSSPVITNCTISDNLAPAAGGIVCYQNSKPTITNCILWDNYPPEISGYPSMVTYSNIKQDTGICSGEGNMNIDPLFVRSEQGNYYLNPNSPCIDYGTDTNTPSHDMKGIARPQGAGVDMGAYEYLASDSCTSRASFIVDQTAGVDILTVTFDASSSGGSLHNDPNFIWEFGDGTSGSGLITTHTYHDYGSYDVSLTITTECGSDTFTLCDLIKIKSSEPTKHVGENQVYSSIQEAIDEAVCGDMILVHDGIYKENINLKGKTITVISENGPASTIIDGKADGSVVTFNHREDEACEMEGFTIQNGSLSGIYCEVSSPSIRNCIIRRNTTINDGGGIYCSLSSPKIINCNISENLALEDGGGMYSEHLSPIVTNCIINRNTAGERGGAISALSFSMLFTNCTVYGNLAFGSVGGIDCSYSTVTNCILWNNSPEEIYGSHLTVTYSNIKQEGDVYPGIGNINLDPLFMGSDQDNYYLNPNSPCIDSGTLINAPAEDREGIARPQGQGVDMGAYESVHPISCTPLAIVTSSKTSGNNPLTILFDASASGGSQCPCAEFSWDFGDGSGESGRIVSHTYPGYGYYHVSLTITIDQGSHTTTLNDFIRITSSQPTKEVGEGYAYASIQEAIDDSVNGEFILVHDGFYEENINFNGKAVTLVSENGAESTFIDGNSNGSVVTFNQGESYDSILDGFTIQNGSEGGICCDLFSCPTIRNCIIKGNMSTGDLRYQYGGGLTCLFYSSPRIEDCRIIKNFAPQGGGIRCYYSFPLITNCFISNNAADEGGGIYCNFSSPTITNCIISENSAFDYGGAIYCSSSIPVVNNCTISKNLTHNTSGGISCSSSFLTITNSILWNDSPEEIYHSGYSPNVTYSNIQQEQGTFPGVGNINEDPLFIGYNHERYYLMPGSPCIDKGALSNAPEEDMAGIIRPQGDGVDMGAYEYVDPESDTPRVLFTVDQTSGSDYLEVTFDASSSGAGNHPGSIHSWDFGDGSKQEGVIVSHEYTNYGYYDVSLSITTDDGIHSLSFYGLIKIKSSQPTKEVGDGYEYANIQRAIDEAVHGEMILVHDGTYMERINFKGKGITIHSERGADHTIIDGDKNGSVVTFNHLEDKDSKLNGFTIQNGSRSGIYCSLFSSPNISDCIIKENKGPEGGGIYCYFSSPDITHCIIKENDTHIFGGGIYCSYSSPHLSNCDIINNSGCRGGGICSFYSSPSLFNCNINDNTVRKTYNKGITVSSYGGGIYYFFSSTPPCFPSITSCTISNNKTYYQAGGIYCNSNGSPSSLIIASTIISDNTAIPYSSRDKGTGGGIMCYSTNASFSLIISACTITNNTASVYGGGIYYNKSTISSTIKNSIIWGNSPDEIYGFSPAVTYSNIQGGYDGWGNIDENPLFLDPNIGDYHLKPDSPCIDSGTNGEAPSEDRDGVPKPKDGDIDGVAICDMGAYEYPGGLIPPTISIASSNASEVTITWEDIVYPDPNGYYLYYKTGTSGQPYDGEEAFEGKSPIDIGKVSTYTIHGLEATERYFFVLTAYDSSLQQSEYSNEVMREDVKPGEVSYIESSTPNGFYKAGDDIEIIVRFSEPVKLPDGTMVITLDTLSTITIDPFSTRKSISCIYTIQEGDNSVDLQVTNLELSGGTLSTSQGGGCDLSLPLNNNLSDNKDIIVDTMSPSILGPPVIDFTNSIIDLTFSEKDLHGVRVEANYTFNPILEFVNPMGFDNITNTSDKDYCLNMAAIPAHTIYSLTLGDIMDTAGNVVSPAILILNDDDKDLIADDWEKTMLVDDPNSDPDKDGYSNLEEYLTGSDPLDDSIFPGAQEICDGKDNDCDGEVDEGVLTTFYMDADGDGYGDPNWVVLGCFLQPGFAANDIDCDDHDPNINPMRTMEGGSLEDLSLGRNLLYGLNPSCPSYNSYYLLNNFKQLGKIINLHHIESLTNRVSSTYWFFGKVCGEQIEFSNNSSEEETEDIYIIDRLQ